MQGSKFIYFVSDIHLGLFVNNPFEREKAFIKFLQSINNKNTESLYLLGDIWDFWYEYKDVVPKGSIKVFSAILDLIDNGISVYFCKGNHDIWCYSYFEELGIKIIKQPYLTTIKGKKFCLGHGDGLGPGGFLYKTMRWIFHNEIFQYLFSMLHPNIAFKIGKNWSLKNRLSKNNTYIFKNESEAIYKFAKKFNEENKVDYFIFGHFHTSVDLEVGDNARLYILKDWINLSTANYLYFDGISIKVGYSQNIE